VLASYQGTILLVSHDRYLIDALGTQIWEIEPDETWMRVFSGTYSQYRAQQEAEAAAAKAAAEARRSEPEISQKPRPGALSAEEKRRRARLKEVEAQITSLEEQLAALSRLLENPPADPAQVQRLGSEYVRVQGDLDGLMGSGSLQAGQEIKVILKDTRDKV
jgi:ATP-binding cassette subfamily F protein 3